ncbi:MAG: hypothetical protein E8D41_05865 [Nitrospira sp.]|nr:MAG: hypothetical protein E8D41_05865 [Nitrospira sp.]
MMLALFLSMLLLSASATASASTEEWRFRVFLDDAEIGYHRFSLLGDGPERQLESEARYNVKFLYVTVYRYAHDSRERWQGNCLKEVEANTQDNGKTLAVRGTQDGDRFVVTNTRGQANLPACVMTFAYWNPDLLGQSRLLNVQTGEYMDVQVRVLGEETLTVRGTVQRARRYALETRDFRIDLWYSPNKEWLALESNTEGGRTLRYQIQ